MPTRCGVIGSPVAHSRSPALHRAAYGVLGLDWQYDAYEVTEHTLPGFLAGLGDDWRGLSVTMPLKGSIIARCDEVDATARQVQAVNTVLVDSTGALAGHNTDIGGFVAAWREAVLGPMNRAAVLGAGATARSAVLALASVGVSQVSVLARSPNRPELLTVLLAELELDSEIQALTSVDRLAPVDLVVSTIPATAQQEIAATLVERAAAVCEVVYEPQQTPLLAAARRAGLPTTDGLDLLLHQAARQVELMTGCPAAPLEAMRAALGNRGGQPGVVPV